MPSPIQRGTAEDGQLLVAIVSSLGLITTSALAATGLGPLPLLTVAASIIALIAILTLIVRRHG